MSGKDAYSTIYDRVNRTCRNASLLEPSSPLVLMVSGGADSVALLVLYARGIFGKHPAVVLHINHLLRGEHSDADESFVVELCAKLSIPCVVKRVDIPALMDATGENMEVVARRIRYGAAEEELAKLCDTENIPLSEGRILTAHTRTDRVETFYMRSIVGGSTGSLASIPRKRGNIIRPLLDVDGEELREFLAQSGQPWQEDHTNYDTAHLRAFVRHEIIPRLQTQNASLTATLTRSMDLLQEDEAILDEMTERELLRTKKGFEIGREIVFDLKTLKAMNPALARRVIRKGIATCFPENLRLDGAHFQRMIEALELDSFTSDISDTLCATREQDTLVIFDKTHYDQATFSRIEKEARDDVTCEVGAAIAINDGIFQAILCEGLDGASFLENGCKETESTHGQISVYVDADALCGELSIGPPKNGDRMQPFGMAGSKKLSDILIDSKVPRRKRGELLVVRDSEHIVWIIGVKLSNRYRVHHYTKKVVKLSWALDTEAGTMDQSEKKGRR